MSDDLEQTKELGENQEANQEVTPEETSAETSETAPEASPETKEDVSGDKTPTFDKAQQEYIDGKIAEAKAESDKIAESFWQSKTDKALSPLREENARLRKQIREAEDGAFEKNLTEKFGDSQETKELSDHWKKARAAQEEVDKRQGELEERETALANQAKAIIAFNLAKQYEGADEKELLKAETPEEMQTMARDAHIAFLKGEKKPAAKKVDSSVPAAKGVNYATVSFDKDAPSARDMITKGLNKK